MRAYFHAIIFEKLEIRNIRELSSGWKLSLEEMSEVGLKLVESETDILTFAKQLYGEPSSHNVQRAQSFKRVVLSVARHGYQTVLDHSLQELQELYPCSKYTTLPRVIDGNRVDDGRHRLAALLANGYETAVIARCHPEKRSNTVENTQASYLSLAEDITGAAKEFSRSESYITWKLLGSGLPKRSKEK